jgi:hypothetical protein
MAGGRGEAEFRREMRESAQRLSVAAQEASGDFFSGQLGRVDLFATLTFDRRPGRPGRVVTVGSKARVAPYASRRSGELSGVVPYVGAAVVTSLPWVSPRAALAAAMWFRRRLGEGLGCHVAMLIAVEPHKVDESSHIHALIRVDGGRMRGLTIGRLDEAFRLGWFLWYRRYGYCKLLRPKSVAAVCDYCGKYVMKGEGEWRLIGVRA